MLAPKAYNALSTQHTNHRPKSPEIQCEICFELVLGVKLNALSELRSGVTGLDDTSGTVMPRARPVGGVCGFACFFSRGPNRADLEVRYSGVSCVEEGREDLSARVDTGVSQVGAAFGLATSSLCDNPPLGTESSIRMVGVLPSIPSGMTGVDRPEELETGIANGRPARTQGRVV
jgi:hypothetical protein